MRVLQLHAGYKTLADNKLYLFSLICVVVTVGFLPVVLPHIMHPYMIYHIILHVASLSVALFLSFISVAAYMKNRSVKLLLMALGFLTLVMVEAVMLLSATGNLNTIIPQVNIDISHFILLIMITLFGAGILKINCGQNYAKSLY